MKHRTYSVYHGKDGWGLRVEDEDWRFVAAERGSNALLGALGHPCCGKGPLGKVSLSFRALRKVGISFGSADLEDDSELDDDALELLFYRVLNFPNRYYRLNKRVADIELTRPEAHALRPDWVEERESWDDEE